MKNEKMLHAIGEIDDELIYGAVNDMKVKKQSTFRWVKWGAAAACLCLLVVGAVTILPRTVRDRGAGTVSGGQEPVAVGASESVMYSVAVFPADRNLDDVQSAYLEDISLEEAQKETGICDYLPSDLPDGYHFGYASIYVTTMKDGTVYKGLRVTYLTGKAPETSTNEEGEKSGQSPDSFEHEFRISIWNFKPDTSCEIYTAKEIRKELANDKLGNGLFYVQYEDYYVGIEPLSLRTEEILDLIDSMSR